MLGLFGLSLASDSNSVLAATKFSTELKECKFDDSGLFMFGIGLDLKIGSLREDFLRLDISRLCNSFSAAQRRLILLNPDSLTEQSASIAGISSSRFSLSSDCRRRSVCTARCEPQELGVFAIRTRQTHRGQLVHRLSRSQDPSHRRAWARFASYLGGFD